MLGEPPSRVFPMATVIEGLRFLLRNIFVKTPCCHDGVPYFIIDIVFCWLTGSLNNVTEHSVLKRIEGCPRVLLLVLIILTQNMVDNREVPFTDLGKHERVSVYKLVNSQLFNHQINIGIRKLAKALKCIRRG